MNNHFHLDTPILAFRDRYGTTNWTFRHACQGTLILGATGSGKSSSSGRMLALKFLSKGFGGVILTVKNSEKADWIEYCRLTGRENDLVIIEPSGKYHFNFLEYESQKKFGGRCITDNVVDVLKTVLHAGSMKDGGHRNEDSFWENAQDLLLYNATDLAQLAYGKVTVKSLYDIVTTAPKRGETVEGKPPKPDSFDHAFQAAHAHVMQQIDAYKAGLLKDDLARLEASDDQESILVEALPDLALLQSIDQFFNDYYKNLAEKTRSIVDISFTGFLFRLLREPVYSLLCRHSSNILPEDCYLKNKIVLVNVPVKTYHKIGRDAQLIVKYCFMRAWESRDLSVNDRPLFLWQDEAQHFTLETDADFQATFRSNFICNVLLTQNLPNLYFSMGGAKSEYRVKALLGNLATRIFHCNSDIETNKWASESIGDAYVIDISNSQTISGEYSSGRQTSYKLERQVRPEHCMSLKTGSSTNNFFCEAIIQWQGSKFPSGFNYIRSKFNQHFKP